MDGKLKQDGKQHVKVENVTQRPLLGQLLNRLINLVFSSLPFLLFLFCFFFQTYLGSGDTQETDTHQHTSNGHLVITKLDAVKVLNRQGIGGDKTIERENLVHLDSGDKSTSTLADDVGNYIIVSESH